ncbi:MAG TPA: hypothetical protein VG734_01430 [Lacunisphaera sp.]|nr:hypothetical protein [Lacunisphaera sp.]
MATDSARRLHHQTPTWVDSAAVFHIRVRTTSEFGSVPTDARIARALLESAAFYRQRATWHCHLFLIMPDHIHALLTFPSNRDMRVIVGRWKGWQVRTLGIRWQENFFDHRIRSPQELQLKAKYIRENPVVKNLCPSAKDWPWVIGPP